MPRYYRTKSVAPQTAARGAVSAARTNKFARGDWRGTRFGFVHLQRYLWLV